jgi:hypothetical protein
MIRGHEHIALFFVVDEVDVFLAFRAEARVESVPYIFAGKNNYIGGELIV